MSHLKLEALARLVDEAPSPEEQRHLAGCLECRSELEALSEQTTMLGTLPTMLPAPDRWPELRTALVDEGVIAGDGRRHRGPGWGQSARAAAAAFLFLAGGAAGWTVRGPGAPMPGPAVLAGGAAVEEAPAETERRGPAATELGQVGNQDAFDAALDEYMRSGATSTPDPAARLATLDNIVRTTAAALSESPGDPVINGFHLTAVAERQELLRELAASPGQPVF